MATPTDQQLFNYFRMALVMGFLTPQQVSDWADRQLLSRSAITEEIIELSLSARLPFSQIIKNLNLYQGAHDYGLPLNLVLAHAGMILDGASSMAVNKLWSGLVLLLAEDNLPVTVRQTLIFLEEGNERLQRQLTNSVEFHEKLKEFLLPYQGWRWLVEQVLELDISATE